MAIGSCVALLAWGADTRLVLLLVGPPGAGKGTQAEALTKNHGLPAVSTGELLRAEVKAATALGQRIQTMMANGELVPDDVVNGLVARRLAQPDAAKGIILDGYPRTVAQARYLDQLLTQRGYPPVTVLHLDVPDEEVVQRLAARGRADDKPEVIRERLKVYTRETAPILEHYRGGDLNRIDGTGSPEEVARRVDRVVRAKLSR